MRQTGELAGGVHHRWDECGDPQAGEGLARAEGDRGAADERDAALTEPVDHAVPPLSRPIATCRATNARPRVADPVPA